jgi:hypothetical protein
MIIDGLLQFDPALSAITVTRVSTNVIDLLNQRDIGDGGAPPMYCYIGVSAAFTAGGAGTLQVQAQGSVDNATYFTYIETRAFSIAELTPIGRLTAFTWPSVPVATPGTTAIAGAAPRYLRLNYIVATGPMLTGSVNAELVLDAQSVRQYPAGVTITN